MLSDLLKFVNDSKKKHDGFMLAAHCDVSTSQLPADNLNFISFFRIQWFSPHKLGNLMLSLPQKN